MTTPARRQVAISDEKLVEIASGFRDGILDKRSSVMMCYAISAPLQAYLSFMGIETKLVKGHCHHAEHYWLRLKDGRILDATADQFVTNMPKVYLGKPPHHYRLARRGK